MNPSRLEIELYLKDLADAMADDGLSPDAIVLGLEDDFFDNFVGRGIDIDKWMPFIKKTANETAADDPYWEGTATEGKKRVKITERHLRRIILETVEQDAADHYAEHPLGLPASQPWQLRAQIRDEETRLAKEAATILSNGADLPSEDTVLDDPRGTEPLLIDTWEQLVVLAKALYAYKKSGGW